MPSTQSRDQRADGALVDLRRLNPVHGASKTSTSSNVGSSSAAAPAGRRHQQVQPVSGVGK